MSGSDDTIVCNTETKQIIADHSDDLQQQHFDNDDKSSGSSSSDSSDGASDNLTRLPRNRRRRLNHYRRERVKNDIVHIFFRHQHVLSKDHGAYFSYMTALRDAFYITNQDDLDQCLHVLREKKKLSEKDICLKLKYDFDWFLRRVRRLVPEPPVLEKRYTEVFNQYKDIECSKSGKKLFSTAKSLAVHKATIKHIRRNCLSDSPGVSYYSPIRKDRYGLTIYHCHRGTPGNEGLHQKLRQLVRGFSNSPRYMFALLTDYFRVWNQNIDIALRSLPSKYDGLYCGDLLEDEIEKMAKWKHRETPPHPEWVSTRSVQCSGEVFGFIQQSFDHCSDNVSTTSSVSICSDAEAAADELLDGVEYDEEAELASNMPASSQWMAVMANFALMVK
jgi:hypothetical protein